MIGLPLILVFVLWLGLSVFLARKIPVWVGVRHHRVPLSLVLFPVIFVTPVIDEVIGMHQFEQLCNDRAVVHVSLDAARVRRAKVVSGPVLEVPNHWIKIQAQEMVYLDVDTGKPFYTYESLITKGGRIARIARLGGLHSCSAKNIPETSKQLNIEELLKEGAR